MARTKGVMNKNSAFLMKRLQDMYGADFDPIMKAAENAVAMDKIVITELDDPKDRIEAHKKCVDSWDKIANYTLPKLKAIEHSGEIDINDTISDEERTERVATILNEARARRAGQPDQTH